MYYATIRMYERSIYMYVHIRPPTVRLDSVTVVFRVYIGQYENDRLKFEDD